MTTNVYEKVSTRLLCEMLHIHLQKLKHRLETAATIVPPSGPVDEHETFMVLLSVISREYSQSSRDEKVDVIKTWFNDIVVFTRKFPIVVQGIVHVLHYRLNDAPREFEFVASPIIEQASIESTMTEIDE